MSRFTHPNKKCKKDLSFLSWLVGGGCESGVVRFVKIMPWRRQIILPSVKLMIKVKKISQLLCGRKDETEIQILFVLKVKKLCKFNLNFWMRTSLRQFLIPQI